MGSQYAGYAYLLDADPIKALALDVSCQVMPINRKQRLENMLAIPASLIPEDTILAHILFALKHEGVNLQILAQALTLVDELTIRETFDASPTGKYIRIACFLWEHFNRQPICRTASLDRGNYVPLFDPQQYITTQGYKDKRWRVQFNGLGSLQYCITVQRSTRLTAALNKQVLEKTEAFTASLDPDMLSRALSWAYLSETRDSFAIEKEQPDSGRMQRFTNLLRQAHNQRAIDEDYLIELQNATLNNPFERAASFRQQQNYLSNGPGALGVTYIPPQPELCGELMECWITLVNDMPDDVDPLVLGAVVAFGFVYLHPFMDGNGRLSRFMFHHVLCQKGSLSNGLILPVSAVLHDKERDYLNVLNAYSAKVREMWDITYIDRDNLHLIFKGDASIYRYWDATACAELMADASEEAIEQYMKREVAYLSRYDALKKRINLLFDINDKDLSRLVMLCLDQKGRLSKKRRDQYRYILPDEVFDTLEREYDALFDQ
ncbi:Fic family protein [Amphritea sp.]|uniref:Fic family protein n=1 Tax=Amphritea sp. TaxID=1872502 RepID=UPI003D10B672